MVEAATAQHDAGAQWPAQWRLSQRDQTILLDCFERFTAGRGQRFGDAPLAQNPFYRLFDCYRAGYYPFVFSPTNITLFRVTAAAE